MLKKMLAALAIISIPALSQATIAPTWEDHMDFGHIEMSSHLFTPDDSYTYTHDITDNGFDVGDDSAYKALLVIGAHDDGGLFDGSEFMYIDIAGLVFDELEAVNFNHEFANVGLFGLLEINNTGMLEVTVKATKGDFHLTHSTLNVWGHDKSASVPEPGTLALLSFSLLALVGIRRFKKSA